MPQDIAPTSPPASLPPAPTRPYTWYIVGGAVFLVLLGACFFIWQRFQGAPASSKVYRVGVLNALSYFDPAVDGFKDKMTELGYVEGENIEYIVENAPEPVGNQAIVKRFIDEKVDLIFVFPTEATLEAKAGTKDTGIPVVFTAPAIEGNDLVESVQRPGGNLTGVRFPIPEVAAKRFEIMREIAPKARRILIPYLKDYPTVVPALAAIEPPANAAGVTLVKAPFSTPDEVIAYLKVNEKKPGFDAILMIPEPLSTIPSFSGPIFAFADAHRIPVGSNVIWEGDTGPIFGLIPDAYKFGELSAPLADKIFRGANPAEIPVVTPVPVFQINYKAIQKLGLTVSEGLMSTADKVQH